MLELINAEREKAGVDPVVLGDNIAAQLHAKSSLENCVLSHWGVDGLKPYMRYNLAGGYQANGENGLGRNYCVGPGWQPLDSINQEIRDAMMNWMDSSGHRRNILDPWHKKVNIGLAWDRYNINAVQHFEGDYVEYERLPAIESGILTMSGTVKNGATFYNAQIYYDPPPHALTRGQVSRTDCYDHGLQITALRQPLTGNWFYTAHQFTYSYEPCPNPYNVPEDAQPLSFNILPRRAPELIWIPWTTALEWKADGGDFSVKADLSGLLSKYGDGVYSIMVWGSIGNEQLVISQYSIFHGITPPDTYTLAVTQEDE